MSQSRPGSQRIFTYAQAVELLPTVQRLTAQAHDRVEQLTASAETPERVRAEADAVVGEWARALDALGLEIKGLWLVDFDNGSGYYCWRYPEPGLDYYHSYEEGFRGRMRIQ